MTVCVARGRPSVCCLTTLDSAAHIKVMMMTYFDMYNIQLVTFTDQAGGKTAGHSLQTVQKTRGNLRDTRYTMFTIVTDLFSIVAGNRGAHP